MITVREQTFDEERALYALSDALVENCTFEGAADGESAMKEAKNLTVRDCRFHLRYPFWHTANARIEGCTMSETCRAPLWYDKDIALKSCDLNAPKALRECTDVVLDGSRITSAEFGWFCHDVHAVHSHITSEYAFMHSTHLTLADVTFSGKYSFQYVKNALIENCVLDTKDAFWHTENVTVRNCEIKGEYLGWYSKNLHLIDCRISGTQPLCYAKGLVIENCEMTGADLAFENSDVAVSVIGKIDSVKAPKSGYIIADEIGEIITDKAVCTGEGCSILLRSEMQ